MGSSTSRAVGALAILALAITISPATASASCNPPPGLSLDAWHRMCVADIQTIWRYGYANMAYSDFVKQYYLLYLRNAMPGGYQGPASACSIAGQTRCFNNWLMTCNGRQWMTGATRC